MPERCFLSAEAEHALARRARRGDRAALHELVVRHEPLVRAIARRSSHRAVAYEDLVHEGFLGLLDAAGRFDPDRGTRFSTYARWWVRFYVQRYLAMNRHIVAPSQTRAMRRVRRGLREAARRRVLVHGHATPEQLAVDLGVRVAEVLEAQAELGASDPSVDDVARGLHLTDGAPSPEERVARAEAASALHALIEEAMDALDARERLVVSARVLSEPAAPLREVGARLGISAERARQIQVAALKKLRDALRARESRTLAGELLAA